jgi:hypothetical protein
MNILLATGTVPPHTLPAVTQNIKEPDIVKLGLGKSLLANRNSFTQYINISDAKK